MRHRVWLLGGLALVALAGPARAEAIRIATTHASSSAPFLIAQDRGYFAAEGLAAELVYIDAAGPITSAVVSGDVDFGATGLSAGFYNLAGRGVLRIIAGSIYEAAGFRGATVVASNRAWDDGLRSFKDLGGHSIAVTQIGTPLHYTIGRLAETYGFDFKSVRIMPLQSFPNAVAAVSGGTTDAAVVAATYVMPALEHHEAQLLGFVGDALPMQIGAVFVTTRTAETRGDTVRHFLAAFRRATADYHHAFTGSDGRPAFQPGAEEIIDLLAEATRQTPEQVRAGIAYVDADARVYASDVKRQIAWYAAQGMVKADVDADAIIDRRYAITLPTP